MHLLRRQHPSLLSCERGTAFVEFAMSLSVLLLLFLGSIEVTRYVLIMQKVEKIAQTVADVVTQADPNSAPLTTTEMTQIMGAVPDMMNPYAFGASGYVIVTDLTYVTVGASNTYVINWQYCGGGTLYANANNSHIGYVGMPGTPSPPANFTMILNEEIVVAEVFYNFTPLTTTKWSVMGASQIYRNSIFMPRLGQLTGFSSHC